MQVQVPIHFEQLHPLLPVLVHTKGVHELLSETHRRPKCLIGDLDMLYRRPTFPIGVRHAPSETDLSDRRPIGDRHAPSEKDMPDWRPIRDRHVCGDPSETNMPAESNRNLNTYTFKYTYAYILFAYLHILE